MELKKEGIMALRSCYRYGSLDARPGWRIGFSYDFDLVQKLKAAVPAGEREWHGDVKQWWVAEGYEPVLRRLFSGFAAFVDQPRLM